jgi:nickel superoxide dismutase
MSRFRELLAPKTTVHAHCDLPCGVYDPEQARIEAESCYKIVEKMGANSDPAFTTRAIAIK